MTSVSEIVLAPGDLLYEEGDPNDYAYVIQAGEVILFRSSDGQRRDVERRAAGSIVGELSILTGQPRAVSVAAVTNCTVYRISAQQIVNRFERLDPVLRACIETSISFTAAFAKKPSDGALDVDVAPGTLRNWPDLVEQLRLEADLRRGMQRDELSMVYQPIVRMPEGEIVGFEALMRWWHPDQGNIPPDRFIQAAEMSGSIALLTAFAIREACSALRRLRDVYTGTEDLYVTINVSGQDIGGPTFFDDLQRAIDENGIPPSCIRLELTETTIVVDIDTAIHNLGRIRALGCGISIDDFGTGYSNLAYLKSLPMTALKIDRAFAGDAFENKVSRGIVRMLITLGKELEVDIIAEGLETIGDVETLCDLGCRYAQGYYFYKPMSEAELITALSRQTSNLDVA